MWRPRAGLLLTFCVLVFAAANAQEETSCAEHVTAAVTPLQAQLSSVTAERDASQAEMAACRDSYSKLYASWQQQAAETDTLKGSVTDLTSKLGKAEERLTQVQAPKATKLDLPTIATALVGLAKEGAISAAETGKVVFEELKAGKTDRLSALVAGLLSSLRGAASSTVSFIKAEVEEHVPEHIKQKVATQVAQVQELWNKHVISAAWAQPLLKQLNSVNDELKKVVGSALASTPALAPLADPVTIQLLAYAVFALPVVLLMVLPLALGSSAKKPTADLQAAGGKGKKRSKGRA